MTRRTKVCGQCLAPVERSTREQLIHDLDHALAKLHEGLEPSDRIVPDESNGRGVALYVLGYLQSMHDRAYGRCRDCEDVRRQLESHARVERILGRPRTCVHFKPEPHAAWSRGEWCREHAAIGSDFCHEHLHRDLAIPRKAIRAFLQAAPLFLRCIRRTQEVTGLQRALARLDLELVPGEADRLEREGLRPLQPIPLPPEADRG